MADSQSSGSRLRRNMSKIANRSKEKVMRSIGRAEETKDEILDNYVSLINKQQIQMQKLEKDMRQYMDALKAMSLSQKAFYNSLSEIYEDGWAGKDIIASCSERSVELHGDVFTRFQTEVIELLQNHLTEYHQCKVRVEKRGRKLVDYDVARHALQAVEAVKKPDSAKLDRAKQNAQQAKEFYEELNNLLHEQLPTLYDSRLLICVNVFSSVCESEKVFSEEMSQLRTKLNDVLLSLKSAFDNGDYRIQRMQTPLDNGKVSPSTGDNSSGDGVSRAKIATPPGVSSTPPENGNDHRRPPPRLPDLEVLPPPSSDPSTHEYVNLQVGTNPDTVRTVSEDEESIPNKQIVKKSRPQSLYAPATVSSLSVYEDKKKKASDDGSGSADPKKAAPDPVARKKEQPPQDEAKSSKGLFGFLGFRRKSSRASAPTQPLALASAEKEAPGKTSAAVTGATAAEAATNRETVVDSTTLNSQDGDRKSSDAAGSPSEPPFEKIRPTKGEGDHEASAGREDDASDKSNEDVDAAFAAYAPKNDDGSSAVLNEASIEVKSSEPDEKATSELGQGGSDDVAQLPNPVHEAIGLETETQRAAPENDPSSTEATHTAAQSSPQEFSGTGDSMLDPGQGSGGGFVKDQQRFEVNFEDPMSDTSLNLHQTSLDEAGAFGVALESVPGEGFSDSFMPSASDGPSATDNIFPSEPFQTVLEDPDEVLRRDDSVFTEDAPTSPPNFTSADDSSMHLPEFEGDALSEAKAPPKNDVDSSVPECQDISSVTTIRADPPIGSGPPGEVKDLAQAQLDGRSSMRLQMDGKIQPRGIIPSFESTVDIHPHAATPPNTPACENVAFGLQKPEKQAARATYSGVATRPGARPDRSNQELYEDMSGAVGFPRADEKSSVNPLTSQTKVVDEELYKDMTTGTIGLPGGAKEASANLQTVPVNVVDEDMTRSSPKHVTGGSQLDIIKPLEVGLSDDDDDGVIAQSPNPGSQTLPASESSTIEVTIEFPKPDALPSAVNGADGAAIQPIYEEPPRDDSPSRIVSPPKSPGKSVVGHEYPNLPPNYLYSAQALYQYRSSDDDELSFDKGDIVHIVQHPDPEDQDDGWLMGVRQKDWEEKADLASCMGVFPENFTKTMQL